MGCAVCSVQLVACELKSRMGGTIVQTHSNNSCIWHYGRSYRGKGTNTAVCTEWRRVRQELIMSQYWRDILFTRLGESCTGVDWGTGWTESTVRTKKNCKRRMYWCSVDSFLWNVTPVINIWFDLTWFTFKIQVNWKKSVQSSLVTICTAQWSLYVPHSSHYMYRTVVTICTAQWSLYVPNSGHYMYRTVVTICTTSITYNNSPFCPHSVFMCFVWIWEQRAIIFLYSINWLVFITEI